MSGIKDYFENILKNAELLIQRNELKQAAIKHYEFMKQMIKFLTRKYAPDIYEKAMKYGNWGYWKKEDRYGLDAAYQAIRKSMENSGLERLSESLALAWKSALELQREEFYVSFLFLEEETIEEDIENIRRFWERIKNMLCDEE